MSVVDRVRGAINPVKTKAEEAAAEAAELEQHIERTRTERGRRVATLGDLQRRLREAKARQDLLKSRRDLASAFDDARMIDQELTVLDTRVADLTTELTEAHEAINRADPAIPDFQQRQNEAASREDVLHADPAVYQDAGTYRQPPSLVPALGLLGNDPSALARSVRQFRQQLGKL